MRRYDIDTLRVIVFGLLIFYHVSDFFGPGFFFIKNQTTYDWLAYPMLFLHQWRLPLLFMISGMGTFFNISKRNGLGFLKERLVRLLIPLVVGILIVIPPQVYLERLDTGLFTGNYFEFWPSKAFIGAYPDGNLSWHHLWFLPYLLLFSCILTPVFMYLRNHPQSWIIRTTKYLANYKFGIFLLTFPLLVWDLFINPRFPANFQLVGDWFQIVNYGTLFFYGFLFMTLKEVLWENMAKNRRLYLLTAIIAFPLLMFIDYGLGEFHRKTIIVAILKVVNMWAWILAFITYAATYLNKKSRKLSYANQAVYPFYILHQTVIVILGYYLKDLDLGFAVKFSMMIIGTFGISWLIYEFGIRRFTWIRPLFGMKMK